MRPGSAAEGRRDPPQAPSGPGGALPQRPSAPAGGAGPPGRDRCRHPERRQHSRASGDHHSRRQPPPQRRRLGTGPAAAKGTATEPPARPGRQPPSCGHGAQGRGAASGRPAAPPRPQNGGRRAEVKGRRKRSPVPSRPKRARGVCVSAEGVGGGAATRPGFLAVII